MLDFPVAFEVKLKSNTFPEAKIVWLKNLETIDANSQEFLMKSENNMHKISFNARLELDGSVIAIKATNEVGETSSECKISLLCKIRVAFSFFYF